MSLIKKLVFLFFLASIASCKVGTIKVKQFAPAIAIVPQGVKQIALINRSLNDTTNRKDNVLEAIMTGEAILGDQIGAEEAIRVFMNNLNALNKGLTAFIPEKHRYRIKKGAYTANPLDWATVAKICRETGCGALLALERFDTNSDAALGAVATGVGILTTGRTSGSRNVRYEVHFAWTLYDTLKKKIIYTNSNLVQRVVSVPMFSPIPTEHIVRTGGFIGQQESFRFVDMEYWVSRACYKKGKGSKFKQGYRYAKIHDWNEAEKIWMKYANSSDSKAASPACFNMALLCETRGQIAEAITWAKKAYSEHNVRRAKNYVYNLENRLANKPVN